MHASTNRHELLISRFLELLRFGATGALSVMLNLAIITFLTERVGFNYLASIATCFATVTFVSFWLNRVWTFRKQGGAVATDLVRYTTTTVVQLVLCLGFCSLLVTMFHMSYQLAVIGLSIVFVPFNYLLHRQWSFNLRWLQGDS
ncbi:MAG: GtrA family protein [Steroidobacteraceae bacterium]